VKKGMKQGREQLRVEYGVGRVNETCGWTPFDMRNAGAWFHPTFCEKYRIGQLARDSAGRKTTPDGAMPQIETSSE
jgi:hypothetical protein